MREGITDLFFKKHCQKILGMDRMKFMYLFHSLELIEKLNRMERESKRACDLWFQIDTEGAFSCTEAARNF